jgi:uncharacterized membrane protein
MSRRKRAVARLPKTVVAQARVRPRLAVSTLLGLATFAALLGRPHLPAKPAIIGWDVGVGLYLVLAWYMMLGRDVERDMETMRRRARDQDDGAFTVLVLSVAATLASLGAIVSELARAIRLEGNEKIVALVLAGVTIFLSWAFVHTAFALHYAHEFYFEHAPERHACLAFPGRDPPGYVDFLYFSFVIGTTSQTADVEIASTEMRRLALAQGVIAFVFNTTLLALSINIAAGLIGAAPPGHG